jgi:glycosyltransferase involved in cell wall biosynthesis
VVLVNKALFFFKPDICYLTISTKDTGFYKDALVVLLVKLYRVKRMYHFHNKGVKSRQDRFFDDLLYKLVFKNVDVILLSKHLYPDLQKYVPEDRVHYCPNGIPEVKSEWQSTKGNDSCTQPEILFLSNLIESKGVFILIDALKLVQERGNNFHCTMIGGDGDVAVRKLKETIEAKGLADYIEVPGNRYGREKEIAFFDSDIFVMPTYYHYECMPLVIIEAMRHSLPVISTFEGAIPDLVEDGVSGFLVHQKDSQALANKLEVLLKDPDLRKRMGAAGRAKYEEQFTLERFERRMVDILRKVADKPTVYK